MAKTTPTLAGSAGGPLMLPPCMPGTVVMDGLRSCLRVHGCRGAVATLPSPPAFSTEVAVKVPGPPAPLISHQKRHQKRHISKLGVLIRKKVWKFGASLR